MAETLSPGAGHDVVRAFRQVLAWAVPRNVATRNPSEGIKNPKRKRHERRQVVLFESWDQVQAVAAIEGGMNPMLLAPLMGTSMRELEETYFRWLGRTDE